MELRRQPRLTQLLQQRGAIKLSHIRIGNDKRLCRKASRSHKGGEIRQKPVAQENVVTRRAKLHVHLTHEKHPPSSNRQ